MRRRLAKSIFHWLVLGIFAATSFSGSALHELFGHCHAAASRRAADDTAGAAVSQAEDCHDASTCPICQYLAQGQVVGLQVAAESVYLSVPRPILAVPVVAASPVLQPFSARAPPVA